MRPLSSLSMLALCALLAACEQIAELDGSKAAEAEGKATGGACRHAGRALEDCYTLNQKASRSAVFSGWREMNDYMTQNKIDPVAPVEPPPTKAAGKQEGAHANAGASAHAQPDPLSVRRPVGPHDAGKSAVQGKVAGAAPVAAAQIAGAGQGVAVERGSLTPQEIAAALFVPPDAAGAAASLPAKVLAGRGPEKPSH